MDRPLDRDTTRHDKVYGVIQQPVDEFVHRLFGAAYTATSWLAGVEITMLTTLAAKNGKPRTVSPCSGSPTGTT